MWKNPKWISIFRVHCCSLSTAGVAAAFIVVLLIVFFVGSFIFSLRAQVDTLARELTAWTKTMAATQMKASQLLQRCHNVSRDGGVAQAQLIQAVRSLLSKANSVLNPHDILGRKHSTAEY
ncbi:hypothetical protein BsWGS_27035 [Bradybaena similaris]